MSAGIATATGRRQQDSHGRGKRRRFNMETAGSILIVIKSEMERLGRADLTKNPFAFEQTAGSHANEAKMKR